MRLSDLPMTQHALDVSLTVLIYFGAAVVVFLVVGFLFAMTADLRRAWREDREDPHHRDLVGP